jgi:FG-GAP-like repeat/FG-GAP repeat
LRNTGAGSFLPRVSFGVGDEPRAVAAADLDADGFADIATANTSAGTLSILRNQAAPGGTWLGLGQTLGDQRIDAGTDGTSLTPSPVDVAVVQLNGEAGAEIAVANEGSSSIAVFGNDPALRTWAARWNIPPIRIPTTRPPTTIEPDDLDEDKWDDLIYASGGSGTAGIVLNDRQMSDGPGLLTFRPAVEVPLQTGDTSDAAPSSIVLADLDDDGDADLAVAAFNEAGTRTVLVLRNDAPIDGTVTLSRDADLMAGDNPQVVLAADVNADAEGREDLIVLNGAAALARGMKPAESHVLLSVPPCPGDADGDGFVNFADVTIVLANWGQSGPPYRPGDADGSGIVNFADITAVLAAFGDACTG